MWAIKLLKRLGRGALIAQLTWVPTGVSAIYLIVTRKEGEKIDWRPYPLGDLILMPPGSGELLAISYETISHFLNRGAVPTPPSPLPGSAAGAVGVEAIPPLPESLPTTEAFTTAFLNNQEILINPPDYDLRQMINSDHPHWRASISGGNTYVWEESPSVFHREIQRNFNLVNPTEGYMVIDPSDPTRTPTFRPFTSPSSPIPGQTSSFSEAELANRRWLDGLEKENEVFIERTISGRTLPLRDMRRWNSNIDTLVRNGRSAISPEEYIRLGEEASLRQIEINQRNARRRIPSQHGYDRVRYVRRLPTNIDITEPDPRGVMGNVYEHLRRTGQVPNAPVFDIPVPQAPAPILPPVQSTELVPLPPQMPRQTSRSLSVLRPSGISRRLAPPPVARLPAWVRHLGPTTLRGLGHVGNIGLIYAGEQQYFGTREPAPTPPPNLGLGIAEPLNAQYTIDRSGYLLQSVFNLVYVPFRRDVTGLLDPRIDRFGIQRLADYLEEAALGRPPLLPLPGLEGQAVIGSSQIGSLIQREALSNSILLEMMPGETDQTSPNPSANFLNLLQAFQALLFPNRTPDRAQALIAQVELQRINQDAANVLRIEEQVLRLVQQRDEMKILSQMEWPAMPPTPPNPNDKGRKNWLFKGRDRRLLETFTEAVRLIQSRDKLTLDPKVTKLISTRDQMFDVQDEQLQQAIQTIYDIAMEDLSLEKPRTS